MLIPTASELRLFGVFHSAGGYAALSAGVYTACLHCCHPSGGSLHPCPSHGVTTDIRQRVKCNATPAEAPCQPHTPKQKKAETPQRGASTMMWELKIPSSPLANCKFARTGGWFYFIPALQMPIFTASELQIWKNGEHTCPSWRSS